MRGSNEHAGITAKLATLLKQRGEVTVKTAGTAIGYDMRQEDNVKRVSNALLYLTTQGRALRVSQGIYQLKERNGMETMTESAQAATNGDAAAAVDPDLVCKDCGFVGRSDMGLKSHRTRAHKTVDQDEVFERTGKALEVLFPSGIPFSRLIEIAKLQEHMLRVIS